MLPAEVQRRVPVTVGGRRGARAGAAAAGVAALLIGAGVARADPPVISYRNTVALPSATTDQHGAAFTITGLSGVCRRSGEEYLAVMDNSSRLVRLSVQVDGVGAVTSTTVLGGFTIAETRDFEGIALPTAGPGVAWLSEEGTPALRAFSLADGSVGEAPATPPVFANRRPNLGFESLAASADGAVLWTANESALAVDGPVATSGAGTVVRLLRYNLVGGAYVADAQFAYHAEPLHGFAISNSVSGVSDLLLLPDGRLLVLERSLAFGGDGLFRTRIYLVDFTGATDVSGIAGLQGQPYTPVGKTLLYSGSHTNLEGLALGPALGPGRYAMLGIVDDGDPLSVNALLGFEISGVGPPPCPANCDGSTAAPVLNVSDFTCFLQRFSAGDPYANCDASTVPPALNVADFTCFLGRYTAGCP